MYIPSIFITFLTVPRTIFCALQDEKITSRAWTIILSLIPSDLVWTGALLLSGIIDISHIVHAIHPQDLRKFTNARFEFPDVGVEGYPEWFEASGLGYALEKEINENLNIEQVDVQIFKG